MNLSIISSRTSLLVLFLASCVLFGCASLAVAQSASAIVSVNAKQLGAPVSQSLISAFFEDISFGADGGLYAELVQNRSFDYSTADRGGWNTLTSWTLVQRGGGSAAITTETTNPINSNNPSYLKMTISAPGTGVGVYNNGFFGINVEQGKTYDFSFFARRSASLTEPFTIQLESSSGTVYASQQVGPVTSSWAKYAATLVANATDRNARLVVLTKGSGTVYLDMVSLFPRDTFMGHANGLRKDLAQYLADMKAKALRFPGGCAVHGYSLATAYHWKNSIGPVEERKAQPGFWGYHMSYGMGFYEYFQFCEDIGAEPLPILPAGVSCRYQAQYQVATLLSPGDTNYGTDWDLNKWTQDALDLIEWANGPVTSVWGAKRAAAGHPAPFNMHYIGLGNEDWGDEYIANLTYMSNAIKARYPAIKVIGSVSLTATDGSLIADVVDEHNYTTPAWLLNNNHHYDSYSRSGPKAFLGEFASGGTALSNAICESSFMTGLERNGDQVPFMCYAPLFANVDNVNWAPNLIWFNDYQSYGTPSYYAEKMFGNNLGDINVANSYTYTPPPTAPNTTIDGKIGVGTWNTQSSFDDVSVTSDSTTLFSDPFTSSAAWTPLSGTWAVSGGVYQQSSSSQPALSTASYTVTGRSSYTYTVRAMRTGGTEGFQIVFGFKDTSNYYDWNIGGWANGSHSIEKVVGGSKSEITSRIAGSIALNVWYNIKIQFDGTRIRCYLNDTLIHDVVDTLTLPVDPIAVSSSLDNETGELILKLVNPSDSVTDTQVSIAGMNNIVPTAQLQLLAGSPTATNSLAQPTAVLPVTGTANVSNSFAYSMPPWSLSILRIRSGAFRGEYYDNANLTGLKFVREDPSINFDWGTGSPGASVGADTFSVRWTGQITPAYSQNYTFYTTASDGVRLWVNGQKLIDDWGVRPTAVTNTGTISLQAGVKYSIKLEYCEDTGNALATLEWSSASQARQVIAQAAMSLPVVQQTATIAQANSLADGNTVALDKVVTVAPKIGTARVTVPSFFYIEDADRSGAIRVEHGTSTSDTLSVDYLAHIQGVLETNEYTGERYVYPLGDPTGSLSTGVKVLGINGRGAQSDNSIVARLIRTWGTVKDIAADNSYFTVSDGHPTPTKVLVYGDSKISKLKIGDMVLVNGVVSKGFDDTGALRNVVILRQVTSATAIADMAAFYKFDDTTGTAAADSSGNWLDGLLVNGPTWVAGKYGKAVNLDGANDYVNLPTGLVSSLDDFTIAAWVKLDVNKSWNRIFDFGTGTSTNMFFTPSASGGIRYAIKYNNGGEQQINSTTAFVAGSWQHVAVTLAGAVGTLYVNGVQVGQNTSMTLKPSTLGNTTQNWIGRSQYGDAYLDGLVDDFRIYSRALSATEVQNLYLGM